MLVMMPALCGGGALRAVGDAKGSMMLTLSGAIVNLVLDPLFIFGLNMGIEGAAFATAISRIAMLIYVMHKLRQHQLLGKPDFSGYREFAKRYFHIGLPAILTNLSTPISVVILTVFMAKFGDEVVAGNAVISRIQPVAFAALFALSGAIGPIAGQNLGAKLFDRVDATLQQGIKFVVIYTVITCLIIALLTEVIIWGFNVTGAGIELVQVFCWGLSLIFIFNGITFLTNALFNNLGKAHWATYMNFGKSTIGTLPFVWLGAYLYGPVGIYWGLFIGSAIFALIAWWLCARLLQQIRLAG